VKAEPTASVLHVTLKACALSFGCGRSVEPENDLIPAERGIVEIIPVCAALEVEVVLRRGLLKELQRLFREQDVVRLNIGGVKREHAERSLLCMCECGRERDNSRHEE